jgi:hypothetical protein
MANLNRPFGFLPIQSATGASPNFEMMQAPIAFNDTTAIFRGDPVKKLATGFIAQWTAGTAVSQLAGIFWGCTYLSTAYGKQIQNNFWPGSDVASGAQGTLVANIIPCTGAIAPLFRVQSNSTGIAFADIGLNYDVTIGTGNTRDGSSGAVLDVATGATTATLPFRVEGLYGGLPGAGGFMGIQPGDSGPYSGSATGGFNWVVVRANVMGGGATGI